MVGDYMKMKEKKQIRNDYSKIIEEIKENSKKNQNIQKDSTLRYHTRLNSKGKEVYAPYIEVMLPKFLDFIGDSM